MPICGNPQCGKVVESFTQFCPHCGRETLSKLDKSGWQVSTPTEISMEAFEKSVQVPPRHVERAPSARRVRKASRKAQNKSIFARIFKKR